MRLLPSWAPTARVSPEMSLNPEPRVLIYALLSLGSGDSYLETKASGLHRSSERIRLLNPRSSHSRPHPSHDAPIRPSGAHLGGKVSCHLAAWQGSHARQRKRAPCVTLTICPRPTGAVTFLKQSLSPRGDEEEEEDGSHCARWPRRQGAVSEGTWDFRQRGTFLPGDPEQHPPGTSPESEATPRPGEAGGRCPVSAQQQS